MGANHREGAMRLPIIAIKEVPSGRQQVLDRLEEFIVRPLPAKLTEEACQWD
jgi:hypothetical protein